MSTSIPSVSFRKLVNGLRDGDEIAAQQLVDRFTVPLVQVARRQIGTRLGRRIDAEDIVQSTYRSLFGRMRDAQYELGSGSELWKLLVTLTLNKVRGKAKFHKAARRNMQCEHVDANSIGADIPDHVGQPSVEDAAELMDLVEHFFASCSEQDRAILTLRLQGCSSAEIAEQTGRAQRSVRRLLQRLRERLEAMVKE